MSTHIYKCPNCDAGLKYDARSHLFQCEYCQSDFTTEELESLNKEKLEAEQSKKDAEFDAVVFSCPSCGAEIMTDETTTATFCYYCHNPVVIKERMTNEKRPKYIIPFKIDQKEAEKRFFEWAKKKKFLPNDFINQRSVEKMCGVYFPYWLTDCNIKSDYSATAKNFKVWVLGNLEYTETSVYQIKRQGTIFFDNIKNFAMNHDHSELAQAIQPFKDEDIEDFNMAYLSGFLAEMKTVEIEDAGKVVKTQIQNYSQRLMENTVRGYSSLSDKNLDITILDAKWEYMLLPVWILTYILNGKTYYFALNGQTGKAVGNLPIDKMKLAVYGVVMFLIFFLIVKVIGGIII